MFIGGKEVEDIIEEEYLGVCFFVICLVCVNELDESREHVIVFECEVHEPLIADKIVKLIEETIKFGIITEIDLQEVEHLAEDID